MWMLDDLYNAMPDEWAVYQEFMFADANTFLTYNANMRQLTFDKMKSAGDRPFPLHYLAGNPYEPRPPCSEEGLRPRLACYRWRENEQVKR